MKSEVNDEGFRTIDISSTGGVDTLQIHLNDIVTPSEPLLWTTYQENRLEAKRTKQAKKKSAVRNLTSKQIDELVKGKKIQDMKFIINYFLLLNIS